MKTIRKFIALLLALVLVLSLAGCKTKKQQEKEAQEAQDALSEQVMEELYGVWENKMESASVRYIFGYYTIEQAATIYDENGAAQDISLGNSFGIQYRVLSENQIEIYSVMGSKEVTGDTVTFEKVDDDTLIFDGTEYHRFVATSDVPE